MTSVVDTSVKHFSSSMVNAPVLNGVAGSMISLLDACLKDGFDLKTATSLVVLDGVATLSFAGSHSATQDSVILVAGSSLTALNGEQKVVSISAGVVRFATAQANGTATGSITFKIAPLGWTKAFAGSNVAAYKSSDVEATGMYLRVDDAGTMTCRVVGYEAMSSVDTGTGSFPTTAQISGGGYWAKSSVENSTGNNWTLFGDSRFFIIYVAPSSGANAALIGGFTRAFGDPIALRPSGDAYACALSYSNQPSSVSQFDGTLDNTVGLNFAMPRNYTGLGSSSLHTSAPYTGSGSATSGIDSLMGTFPSAVDGGLRLARKYLASVGSGVPPRADIPGFFWVPQSLAFETIKWGDRVPGTGQISGRNLYALSPTNATLTTPTSGNTGLSLVDITGPWR